MKKAVIIGSGPAGVSAALYIKRAGNYDVTVISGGVGALAKAEKIENYYGLAEPVSGSELHQSGIEGAKRLGVEFIYEQVTSLSFDDNFRPVIGTDKNEYTADSLLIATGSSRKSAKINGIKDFEGKGVSYCAVCDAFFYRNKDVCVVGDGEYASHEASVLTATSKSVTILTDGKEFSAALPQGVELNTKKISAIEGSTTVEKVVFDDGTELNTAGIFVAIGVAGSTDLARKVGIELDGNKIIVDGNMSTNIPGVYSAGDCTGGLLQVAKAVYDGARAGLAMAAYMKKK